MATAAVPVPSAQDLIAAQMRYGPQAGPALQRSQYLANALESLQRGAGDVRTPTALWSTLLADGITQWSKNKADRQAMAAYGADQAARSKADLDAIGGVDVPAPQPSPMAPGGPAAAPAPAPVQVAPSPGPVASAPLPPAIAPADRLALARMVWGEARGEPAEGQQAAAAVAMNRAKSSGKTLADIVSAPHQFEGYNARAQGIPESALGGIMANIAPTMAGQDPTGGATNFYNPTLQHQLGRADPAWAQGQGQTIGHHVFFGGHPQGPQMAQGAAPPMPGQPPAPDPDLGMGPQPQQGPMPPPSPVPPPAGAAPPLAPSSPGAMAGGAGPQMPPQAPQGPQSIPTGLAATPQERAMVQRLLSDPRTYDQGHAMALEIQKRMASPVQMKPGTYWGPDGKAHSVEQFTDQPGSPNAFVQRSTLDNHITAQGNPAFGPLPAGTSMNGQGAISQQPIAQQGTFRLPGVNGVFVTGPDGRPMKVGDDQYGPEQLLKMRENLLGSEPVKLYQQAADAYGSMVAAAKMNPGGMRAYALRDTFARAINPGAVARVGTIQAIKESQGIPAEVKGFFMNLQGDGNVPPEVAQQILDVTHGFVSSHYHGAQQLVQSNAEYAKRHSIDPADVTVPLGDAPQRFVVPTQAPPQGGPAPNPQASQAAAVAAEVARRKAAGTWTGPH